jgi:competence protein CoiA
MIVALVNKVRKIACYTEKYEAPFFCPYCKQEVGIRKGNKKVHHFYHLNENPECENSNESEIHYKIKMEMYEHFKNQPNCRKCEPERILKGVIPDLSLYINDIPVAIEIQKSNISCELIQHRMSIYNQLGIYVLWVLTEKSPQVDKLDKSDDYTQSEYHNLKDWEKYLHRMYYHRLYYWQKETTVKAFHFDKALLYHDGGDYDTSYFYRAKKRTTFIPLEKELVIERDFINIFRKNDSVKLSYENVSVPNCKIMWDNNKKWWETKKDMF